MFDVPSHVNGVLSALQFEGSRTEKLQTLTDAEWKDLLLLQNFHRCMIPLRQICEDALPEWVRLQIDQRLADNAERLERIKADYSRFSDASRLKGASHVVVKGFSLWPGFVDHPRLRLQSDIDIYCPPDSILIARDVLVELEYEPNKKTPVRFADHLPPMVRKTSWKWRGNFYDPEMPVSFELHHTLWNEKLMRLRSTGLEQFWFRRTERQFDGFLFSALGEVDNFGYAALNLTRNLLRDLPSLHQIYELARFLHVSADNQQLWEDWRTTQDDSLRQLQAISCHTAALCFACQLPEEVRQEISCLPAEAKAWFTRFNDLAMSDHFRKRKDWVWLHVSLVEFEKDRFSLIRERLIPSLFPPLGVIDTGVLKVGEHREKDSQLWRRTKYIAYLAKRIVFHVRILQSTILRGVRFWWSMKGLRFNGTLR